MKKSSKNRLTPRQQSFFSGNSLFDKIARAVCRAGTLPRKELYEAWEMAKRVRRRYRGDRIIDLACGHDLKESSTDGLEGWMDKTYKKANSGGEVKLQSPER
jgi:hypothetical protein